MDDQNPGDESRDDDDDEEGSSEHEVVQPGYMVGEDNIPRPCHDRGKLLMPSWGGIPFRSPRGKMPNIKAGGRR